MRRHPWSNHIPQADSYSLKVKYINMTSKRDKQPLSEALGFPCSSVGEESARSHKSACHAGNPCLRSTETQIEPGFNGWTGDVSTFVISLTKGLGQLSAGALSLSDLCHSFFDIISGDKTFLRVPFLGSILDPHMLEKKITVNTHL